MKPDYEVWVQYVTFVDYYSLESALVRAAIWVEAKNPGFWEGHEKMTWDVSLPTEDDNAYRVSLHGIYRDS